MRCMESALTALRQHPTLNNNYVHECAFYMFDLYFHFQVGENDVTSIVVLSILRVNLLNDNINDGLFQLICAHPMGEEN